MHTVKVSSKGRIVIPKEVRERHGLGRRTELVLFESGDTLVLCKKADVERFLEGEFAVLLGASAEALEDLWDNTEDDVWNHVPPSSALAAK
ncbi:MAG: AbrB/MazE/SpoVT family DNA-binding domain-containing protein [Thermoplasmata archaeon]